MDKSIFFAETGQLYYRGIFFETTGADKSGVVYTLKPRQHCNFPSLYQRYMEADDPTEYKFAIENLASWDHWQNLCKCTWFKPYISEWRKELEVRTRSRALSHLKAMADDPTHKSTAVANKMLLAGDWKSADEKKGRGRPSKDEIKTEAARIARESRDIDDDLQRVQGVVN